MPHCMTSKLNPLLYLYNAQFVHLFLIDNCAHFPPPTVAVAAVAVTPAAAPPQ